MLIRINRRISDARLAGDSGVTMVELLVTMTLTAVILTMLGSFFVQVAQTTTAANQSRQGSAQASAMANELSDVIRPATTIIVSGQEKPDPAVVAGTATSLTLYTFADNVATDIRPQRVQFSVNGSSQLVESRWTATLTGGLWTFPLATATPTVTRTFPGTLVAPTAATVPDTTENAPVFTYLDSKSVPLDPGTTGLTLAQRQSVAAIRFTIRTRSEFSTTAKVVVIQNVVGMPNVGLQGKDDS